MPARDVVLSKQHQAIAKVHDVIQKHKFATYLCEAVATLGKRIDELEQAAKPRPRGRPPKVRKG